MRKPRKSREQRVVDNIAKDKKKRKKMSAKEQQERMEVAKVHMIVWAFSCFSLN